MTLDEIKSLYEKSGGEFISSPVLLSKKLRNIKALVFDWDGVFHSGAKKDGHSSFSEVDSMGVNMLRFGYFLQNGELPITAIITGENNLTAFHFAEREHLDGVFYSIKTKNIALDFIKNKHGLSSDEILFVFDDILDLSATRESAVRFLMGRNANPMFINYCKENGLTDYVSAHHGGDHGVREISELSLSLIDQFENTLENRVAFSDSYATYLNTRNETKTSYFTSDKTKIIESNL